MEPSSSARSGMSVEHVSKHNLRAAHHISMEREKVLSTDTTKVKERPDDHRFHRVTEKNSVVFWKMDNEVFIIKIASIEDG